MKTVRTRRLGFGGSLALVTALALSGCGASDSADATDSKNVSGELTVSDAWVVSAEEGMTAVFGTLNNSASEAAVVESAECGLSAVELHEMSMSDSGDAKMKEKEDGFTVKADDSYTLEPGGDHLMLMDLQEPIHAGDEIEMTLQLAEGDPVTFTAVAKDYAGADEEYEGDDQHGDHSKHD